VTVAEALDIYGKEHGPETSDPGRIGDCIVALVSWWDAQAVSAVTANSCRAYARDRVAEGRASATARRELGVLGAAIRYCFREGKLTQEVPVILPAKTPPREAWLTRDEAALLLRGALVEEKARLHLPLFILIGLYTGHRKRAILELQWQKNTVAGHVDLDGDEIDFQGRRKKTKKARGRIPIPRRLLTFLLLARRRTRQYVLEQDRVVDGEIRRTGIDNVKRSFATACRHAARQAIARGRKIPRHRRAERREWARTARKLRAATPHILRHTCTTWLVQKGVPLYEVGKWVGMSTEMVERVYGHHAPEFMKRARDAVDRQA
jgi:integrase